MKISCHKGLLPCVLAFTLLLNGCASSAAKTADSNAGSVNPNTQSAAQQMPQPLPQRQQQAGTIVQFPASQKNRIESAVRQTMPEETRLNTVVDVIQKPNLKYPTVIISHLLEGRSADDSDNTVRGDYHTIPKLLALSQQRSYDILRASLDGVDTNKTSEVIANINHGVGHRYGEMVNGKEVIKYVKNIATNIYSASIDLERILPEKWASMGQSAFTQNWLVEHDETPNLRITAKDATASSP